MSKISVEVIVTVVTVLLLLLTTSTSSVLHESYLEYWSKFILPYM